MHSLGAPMTGMTVGPITASASMDSELCAALDKRPDFLELRTDCLTFEQMREVRAFAERNGFGMILTVKNPDSNGNRELFLAADWSHFDYIDLDYAELIHSAIAKRLLKHLASRGSGIIISYHVFEADRCPEDIAFEHRYTNESVVLRGFNLSVDCEEMMEKLEKFRREIISSFRFRNRILIKFACFVRDDEEAELFGRLAAGRTDFVAVPMGEAGRRLRLRLHSANPLSYGYLCVPNAPGQPSVEEYKSV